MRCVSYQHDPRRGAEPRLQRVPPHELVVDQVFLWSRLDDLDEFLLEAALGKAREDVFLLAWKRPGLADICRVLEAETISALDVEITRRI